MKIIKKLTALFTIVSILFSVSAVSAGAITVEKEGRQYTLNSHTPTTGDVRVLMIRLGFADYSVDDKENPADSEQTLLSYFNGSEESVNGFYRTSSYGKLRLSCDRVFSYNAQNERKAYDQVNGLDELLSETLTAIKDSVSFDDYDSDGDGYFDFVCFDFAGPMGEWGSVWWPHVSHNGNVTIDGKRLASYSIVRGSEGTFKHEFGHILGAPDYYSYEKSHDDAIMTYDMMSSKHGDHNGFTKWSYGWLTDDDIAYADKASGGVTIELKPFETDLGNGKKIAVVAPSFNSETPFLGEYFLVEYDEGSGNNKTAFDTFRLRPGFRIFHVNAAADYNEAESSALYRFNNDHLRLNLIHNVRSELEDPNNVFISEMFFREGDSLTPKDYPNTGFFSEGVYNGSFTGISFTDFVTGDNPSFKVSFSDEEITQTLPDLTLTNKSENADIKLLISSDKPIAQRDKKKKPTLTDPKGNQLSLDVTEDSVYSFTLVNRNVFPAIEPETEYTLIIPEGFFITGYRQAVPEFRQTIKTDKFRSLTTIDKYSVPTGSRSSSVFAVTESTYGRVVLNDITKTCTLTEYNLNGEELARTTFEAPEYKEKGQRLFGCAVYPLNDGSFAFVVNCYENTYFTKIGKNGGQLSKTFTVSNEAIEKYVQDMGNVKLEPYKDGLCCLMKNERTESAAMLTIDFENEPQITDVPFDEMYYPLSSGFYIKKGFRDGVHHLYVCDSSDRQTADITLGESGFFMGAFMKNGNINVVSLKYNYSDVNKGIVLTVDVFDTNGSRQESEGGSFITPHLVSVYKIDRIVATESGYFIVTTDDYDKKRKVIVCDSAWDQLAQLTFDNTVHLEFLGECGLSVGEQVDPQSFDTFFYVSRFNIGDFEIVPAPERLWGDADGDGSITISDATLIQKAAIDLVRFSDEQKQLADVNGDGRVSVLDATCVQKYIAQFKTGTGKTGEAYASDSSF